MGRWRRSRRRGVFPRRGEVAALPLSLRSPPPQSGGECPENSSPRRGEVAALPLSLRSSPPQSGGEFPENPPHVVGRWRHSRRRGVSHVVGRWRRSRRRGVFLSRGFYAPYHLSRLISRRRPGRPAARSRGLPSRRVTRNRSWAFPPVVVISALTTLIPSRAKARVMRKSSPRPSFPYWARMLGPSGRNGDRPGRLFCKSSAPGHRSISVHSPLKRRSPRRIGPLDSPDIIRFFRT